MTTATEFLGQRQVRFEALPHKEAHTAIQEALSLGASPDEVLKAVVVMTRSGPVLMVLPAMHRLDLKLVREVVNDAHARLATENEVERLLPEYDLGAIPPLPSLVGLPVYLDQQVMEHDVVIIPAGRAELSLRAACEDLFGNEPIPRIVPCVATAARRHRWADPRSRPTPTSVGQRTVLPRHVGRASHERCVGVAGHRVAHRAEERPADRAVPPGADDDQVVAALFGLL